MPYDSLTADAHPILNGLYYGVLVAYAVAWLVTAVRPTLKWGGRWVLAAGVIVHLVASMGRGIEIQFFPLTNKLESFSAAALCIAIVAFFSWRPNRIYLLTLLAVAIAALAFALTFPLDLAFPPPLMQTIWYPLHIPFSFFAYALWVAAAAASFAWLRDRNDPTWLQRIDRMALQGFGLWTLSMICGGIWGVLAWGAYFMWDPKVLWSVILWFHYASFIHLRMTPSLRDRPWVRPVFAIVGLLFVFVAYVGTSFFFGKGSHAFG